MFFNEKLPEHTFSVVEFIRDFNNYNNNERVEIEDLIRFFANKGKYYHLNVEVLEYLQEQLGTCQFIKDLALKVWIYENFAYGSLRQIARAVSKSEYFNPENIDFYKDHFQAIKNSVRLNGQYYEDGMEAVAGEYDHTKVIDILTDLINPFLFIDRLKEIQRENDLFAKLVK